MLDQIQKKHERKLAVTPVDPARQQPSSDPQSAENIIDEDLKAEVEQLGAELGKRASDQLAIGQTEQ